MSEESRAKNERANEARRKGGESVKAWRTITPIMLESEAMRSGGGVVCRHDNIIFRYRLTLRFFFSVRS